jgi:hypothetical protein
MRELMTPLLMIIASLVATALLPAGWAAILVWSAVRRLKGATA